MTKKYIVKNCPCIYKGWETMHECFHYNKPCTDCTDCLIKQVVEKCKEHRKFMRSEKYGLCERISINDRHEQKYPVEDEILQLFTIEEVE